MDRAFRHRQPATANVGDADAADFRAGTAERLHLASTSNGPELVLAPAVVAEFGNGVFPKGWFIEPWKEGGTAEPSAGALQLDGAKAGYVDLFGSGRSLEFVATFHKRPHQHVGFGTNFNADPCVTFTTKFGHGLYARSHFARPEETRLPSSLLGAPHRFRIDWNFIEVSFWVDGERLAHQLVPVVGYMRPLVSNASIGRDPLTVEWVRMTPYAKAGTFVSRVLHVGEPVEWERCEWDAEVPAGTSLRIEVRSGDTAPDGEAGEPAWEPWRSVDEPGGAIGTKGRFAQYRATFATTDRDHSPSLRSVILSYSPGQSRGSSSSGGGSIGM